MQWSARQIIAAQAVAHPTGALAGCAPTVRTDPCIAASIRALGRRAWRRALTDEETFALTRELALKLGKTPVAAEDFPAFIVNRILLPMINEAIYTLYEGVGNVEAIDTAMRLGANHPMGPLQLADFIGLDTCLSVMQVLHEGLADSKYRPCPLLVKYVDAGWFGRKSGQGFYKYGPAPVV